MKMREGKLKRVKEKEMYALRPLGDTKEEIIIRFRCIQFSLIHSEFEN